MASPSMQERRADDRGAAVKVGIAASWRLRMRQRRGAPAATTATGAVACVGRGQLGLSAKISPPRVGTSPSCSKGHTCAGRTRCISSDHSSAVAEAGDWLADYLTSLGGQADSKDCKLHGRAAGHSEAPAPLPYLRPATLAYGHGTERIGVLPLLAAAAS